MSDVSVIIACYNAQPFIAHAIRSALAQTHRPCEIIVIDDGSTDGSTAEVRPFAADGSTGVQLVRQDNAGESAARNRGIDRARGEFVAFLDADDVWVPEKLARQLALFQEHRDVAGVHCRAFDFENEPDDLRRVETTAALDDPTIADLIKTSCVFLSTLMVRREVLINSRTRFDEVSQHGEHLTFAADLRLLGPLRLVDEALVGRRRHDAQQTSDTWHAINSLEQRARWVRAHRKMLGEDVYVPLDGWIGRQMVDTLVDRYWRRRLRGFRQARRRVRRLYPNLMRSAGVANRIIGPRWWYLLADNLNPSRRKLRRHFH